MTHIKHSRSFPRFIPVACLSWRKGALMNNEFVINAVIERNANGLMRIYWRKLARTCRRVRANWIVSVLGDQEFICVHLYMLRAARPVRDISFAATSIHRESQRKDTTHANRVWNQNNTHASTNSTKGYTTFSSFTTSWVCDLLFPNFLVHTRIVFKLGYSFLGAL